MTIELDPDSDICRIDGEFIFYGAFDEPDYIENRGTVWALKLGLMLFTRNVQTHIDHKCNPIRNTRSA